MIREGVSCFSSVRIASAAMLIFHPSRPRHGSARSSAPFADPAPRGCSLDGAQTVEANWLCAQHDQSKNWPSFLPQLSAFSDRRDAEEMMNRRSEFVPEICLGPPSIYSVVVQGASD